MGISVPEVINIFKEIKGKSGQLFEMIRNDTRDTTGHNLVTRTKKKLQCEL